jgi:hypothetical protein
VGYLKHVNRLISPLLTLIIIALIGVSGYLYFQNRKLSQKPSASPDPSPQAQSSPLSSPTSSPAKINIREQIEAAVNSKNYAALEGYMTTPTVNFALMSSECCEPQTPKDAVEQLDYISAGVPFDFNQQNATILNLKAKNPELTNAYLGISKTGEHSAAFTIDNQNKISGIHLSVSWKLYNF